MIFGNISLIFPRKQDLTFHANCVYFFPENRRKQDLTFHANCLLQVVMKRNLLMLLIFVTSVAELFQSRVQDHKQSKSTRLKWSRTGVKR